MAFALRDGPLACAIKFSLGLTWNNLPPSRGQGTLHFKLRFILWYKFIFIDLLIYIYIYIYIYIGAPSKHVAWIRECITNLSYSIALNGTLVGYF
jgi:hypothetical protein